MTQSYNLRSLLVNVDVSSWLACSTRSPDSGEKGVATELATEAVNQAISHFTQALMTKILDIVYQEQRSQFIYLLRGYR
jgi:hypothetical protein